jgi:2-oxo-4-hydroxy-4-carboxy--5-ureidoimidazoline (OHCU) decarboxylase
MASKNEDTLASLANKIDMLKIVFGNELLTRIQEYTPVRTGLLRDSWVLNFDEEAKMITLTNTATNRGVPYAIYVEEGTRHMAGFFMLLRTMNDAESLLEDAMDQVGLD